MPKLVVLIQQDDMMNQQSTQFSHLISATWHSHVRGRKITFVGTRVTLKHDATDGTDGAASYR